ncbi:uncharacterized protein LOC111351076 isoform X1 [Spodoptera litura]|uniref:Uncharacterized protein LOC111351076 isoform X1 n=1 Tax=Spodoptera litura TaxID=69820 RepID=A0A9J7IMS3_SPOLT|nr:uncharacterized protein LOC111351076 isoform X1 [Spodoptera litura]XP_022818612.1 uncharacterized protein LOC111351076 isoform X1 [Spodoptera litura]
MYWDLSSLQRQRDFLNSAITVLQLAQRRLKTNVEKNKRPNTSYSLISSGRSVRVCKLFLLNTLGISERTLRTVVEAKTNIDSNGVAPIDKRGRHENHKKTCSEVQESVRIHINSISRIESHYLRANTNREFIDGGLSIADLHRDYKRIRELENKEAATYDSYFRTFNTEFNISFFTPKKDQCDVCEQYKNAVGEDKEKLESNYTEHCRQKLLSRMEKKTDIELSRNRDSNEIVAIYDLQAVMPVPVGESSSFYYKSKLNCFNLTVTDIKEDQTYCYFWHEAMGSRGATEIGSCILKYLRQLAVNHPGSNITFYTDNCGGQQKNRFIFSLYLYAVKTLAVNKITHKFLIRGHTQNEGDTAHSIIEKAIKKAKKSGAIYVPDQYVQIIRSAKKKGNQFIVEELNFDDFYDVKKLTDEIELNTFKDVEGNTIKTSDIRAIEFRKDNDAVYRYKLKYDDNWIEAEIKKKSQRSTSQRITRDIRDIIVTPVYNSRRDIPVKKKNDLKELLQKNIIPRYYSTFYDSIF